MKILTILGTLDTGKSTLIQESVRTALQLGAIQPSRMAYILNDDMSKGLAVGGHEIADLIDIIPLPSICFCCYA